MNIMYSEEMDNEVKMVLLSSLTKLVIASGIDSNVHPAADWGNEDTLFVGHLLTFSLSVEGDMEEGFRGYVITMTENKNELFKENFPSKEAIEAFFNHRWEILRLLRDLVDVWVKIRRPGIVVNNYIYIDCAKSMYQSSLAVMIDNLHYEEDLEPDLEE